MASVVRVRVSPFALLVIIAQLAEHEVVDLGVAGSKPVGHPCSFVCPVTQSGRVSA